MLKLTSRDNSRTPMQWSDAPQAGFTRATKTWLPVNPNYMFINVADEIKNQTSVLNYYRSLIRFRRSNLALIYGDYEDIDPRDAKIFSYALAMDGIRYLVVLNMSSEQLNYTLPQMLKPGRFVIGNMEAPVSEGSKLMLRPWEARIYKRPV
jgi:oligo-1,6-glucosidase